MTIARIRWSGFLPLAALAALLVLVMAVVSVLNGGSDPFANPVTPVVEAQDDETLTVRIIARRAPDGRVEFGMRPPVGDDIFPRARYIAASGPAHNRWLRSSEIDFGDGFVGRIIGRREGGDPNGRIEFGFRVEGYDDIFPRARFFPASGPDHHRWLRSSEIHLRRPRSDDVPTASDGTVRADGASITIPAGAAAPDARVTVRKVDPDEAPSLPDYADNYGEVFDFEIEGGFTGEVEVRYLAPDDDEMPYVVVHYENGSWNPTAFELDGDEIVVHTDSLSLFGYLQLGIVKAIEYLEGLMGFDLSFFKQLVKPQGPPLCRTDADDIEVVEDGRRTFKTGGILGFGAQEVYALAGCAEPASGGSMLRVKNRLVIWLDVFPGIEEPGFQPRNSSVGRVLGIGSAHEDGTLVGPGWEAQWSMADGTSGVLLAEPSAATFVITALMQIPDALAAAAGEMGEELQSVREDITEFVKQVRRLAAYTKLLSDVELELQRGDDRTPAEVLTAIAAHIYPVLHKELLSHSGIRSVFNRLVGKLLLKLGVKLPSKAILVFLAKTAVATNYVKLVGHVLEDAWSHFTDRYRALGTVTATPIQDSPGDSEGALSDREVLTAFYHATNGEGWTNSDGWLTDAPLGQWHGVTVDGDGRVLSLWLRGNQLYGEIPAKLGSLANLETLVLDSNQLSGEIPAELGALANLVSLSLAENQLSGEIPAELGALANLRGLWLGLNQLSGEIPAELGALANLEHLGLIENQLSGEIPAELGALANLKSLFLHGNQLSGCVPSSLRYVESYYSGLPFCP